MTLWLNNRKSRNGVYRFRKKPRKYIRIKPNIPGKRNLKSLTVPKKPVNKYVELIFKIRLSFDLSQFIYTGITLIKLLR